jgi:hypothetical protein
MRERLNVGASSGRRPPRPRAPRERRPARPLPGLGVLFPPMVAPQKYDQHARHNRRQTRDQDGCQHGTTGHLVDTVDFGRCIGDFRLNMRAVNLDELPLGRLVRHAYLIECHRFQIADPVRPHVATQLDHSVARSAAVALTRLVDDGVLDRRDGRIRSGPGHGYKIGSDRLTDNASRRAVDANDCRYFVGALRIRCYASVPTTLSITRSLLNYTICFKKLTIKLIICLHKEHFTILLDFRTFDLLTKL